MNFLKQSTAVDIMLGPFLDETDGKTAETALTITQPDIRLSKNGGAYAQKSAAQTLVHGENGWYPANLSTTDTNTLGALLVAVHEAGALPVWRQFMVVPAQVYDSLFGADVLQVDVAQWLGTAVATPTVAGVPETDLTHIAGDAQSATDLKDFADAGYDPATNKVEGVKLADLLTLVGTNGITAGSLADAAIDANALAADMDGYTGKLSVIDDDNGTADRWVMVWYKNGVPISAGITSPTVQVVKLSDGTDLVAPTAMTQVSSTPFFQKVQATTNRIVDGEAYGAIASATIGGAARTWPQIIGRPS